jgi:hypothetical protein
MSNGQSAISNQQRVRTGTLFRKTTRWFHNIPLLIANCSLLIVYFQPKQARAAECVVNGVSVECQQDGAGFRADIQSTSVDWEAVSGLRLSEYKITFANAKAAGAGWEMYFLDEFPCYGVGQYVRAWVGRNSDGGFLRANCIRRPDQVRLAYRPAKKNDPQGRTDGILKCRVDKNLSVDLSACERQDWADWAKE